jgi:putative ABC transport system permease protein
VNTFQLSFNLLRRDWRAGEWRVLLLALLLAVGSLSTVGLFADRVRQALQQQAQSLIGADLRLTSSRPLPAAYRQLAEKSDLRVVQTRTFPSMVAHGESVLLSEIMAVEAGYPLRGKIEIAPTSVSDTPQRGTVWLAPRLLQRLNLKTGDSIGLGARQFVVAAQIVKDIDQSVGFASIAPRLLMNELDLPDTGLLQEGSRVTYRFLFAGDAPQVEKFRSVLAGQLSGNEKLEDVRDARPEIRTALERAEHFLGLAALSAAILAGAAMALASRRFVLRHLDSCAVMRCLGAQQNQIISLFLLQFIILGALAILLGSALGYVTQTLLVNSIAAMREADLPLPSLWPVLKSALSGAALLFGFTFLPLLQLGKVSPLRVLRRELGAPSASVWSVYGLALLVLAALFLWQAGSWKLGAAVLAGLLVALTLFAAFAWLVLRGLVQLAPRLPFLQQAHSLQFALANLFRHGGSNALQIVALSLGGMALLLLTLVRADLLQSWQAKLPADAPNRFLLNVQPEQRQTVLDFFAAHALPPPDLLPMVRGRLIAINQREINADTYAEPRAKALVEREFNLSYSAQMPSWNEQVSGAWWQAGQGGQLSVEEGLAKTLNIHLGDTLSYDVAGSRFSARVSQLRQVHWDSMRVNFFVIASPDVLQDLPTSYLSSFYLPPDKLAAGEALIQQLPTLLLIDSSAILEQLRNIIDQISNIVSALFIFTLLSGFAVLYAALLATHDERSLEAVILRTLGADSGYLRRLYRIEFAVLGGLSGLFAAGGAMLLGGILAHFVLEIPYQPSAWIPLFGVLVGVIGVIFAGSWMTRPLLKQSPLRILAVGSV